MYESLRDRFEGVGSLLGNEFERMMAWNKAHWSLCGWEGVGEGGDDSDEDAELGKKHEDVSDSRQENRGIKWNLRRKWLRTQRLINHSRNYHVKLHQIVYRDTCTSHLILLKINEPSSLSL